MAFEGGYTGIDCEGVIRGDSEGSEGGGEAVVVVVVVEGESLRAGGGEDNNFDFFAVFKSSLNGSFPRRLLSFERDTFDCLESSVCCSAVVAVVAVVVVDIIIGGDSDIVVCFERKMSAELVTSMRAANAAIMNW